MLEHNDRRFHVRFAPQTLALIVGGREHALIDLSTGGLSFEAYDFRAGSECEVTLRSLLDPAEAVTAHLQIINVCNGKVGGRFIAPTLPLLSLIVWQLGHAIGVTPHVLGRGPQARE